MSDNPDRLGKLMDLTRWNRAGLPRFQYVDGDAAAWLEELRIAMMGLTARGAPMEERLPETWRHRFSQAPDQWPAPAERAAFLEALDWAALARAWPDAAETARRRNARLLDQYGARSADYGWEIMRAVARAAHVLLGHQNAYANEGYIRTATQWRNLARLAAMVNHQPAPPTSATTTIGLIVDPTADGAAVEIPRGLAMKHAPAEGGAPVVFETLVPLKAHPDLNAARAVGWNRDPEPLAAFDRWIDDEEAELAPGALGVLADAAGTGAVDGVLMLEVERDADAGEARIRLDQAEAWTRGDVALHVDPKGVRRGLPRSITGTLVLKIDTAANYPINSVVRLHHPGGATELLVSGAADGRLKLAAAGLEVAGGTEVTVETLAPVSDVGGGSLAPASVGNQAWFLGTNNLLASGNAAPKFAVDGDGVELEDIIGYDFGVIANAVGSFYVQTKGARREGATVAGDPPAVVLGDPQPRRVVSFDGKPPKGLAVGDLMVMREAGGGAAHGLRIAGIATGAEEFSLQFHRDMPQDVSSFRPDAWEFHGPLLRALRPVDHDRNPRPAFDGPEIRLTGLSEPSRELVRLGKTCLVEDERGLVPPVLARLVEAIADGEALRLLFEPAGGLPGFLKGWTVLNLNAVPASHGETRSPKTLGSGNGEKALQSFPFAARGVSFVPSTVAETGVAPDMEVTVDGVLWSYRDLIDPTADGTQSWSMSLTEDGALAIYFRRRLPTGADNVVVRRHRIGVGPGGAVPARVFAKPMKKHRHVRALTQPYPATGGAEREPVEDIRVNAPARLAANGRAVSLRDFERLCRRRSDVWQAKARSVVAPSAAEQVAIVIVPANGGAIGPTLRADLTAFVERRTLPGVRVALEDFEPVRLMVEARIRVDAEAFDKTAVQAAAQDALIAGFSLERRALGRPAYISEVVALLERVEGVETATVRSFRVPSLATIRRTARTGGSPSAFFPFDNQVISVRSETAGADMAVAVETI